MHITMPRPTIKCGKCGSADIAIPERSANAYDPDDCVLLKCRQCGHEKRSGHKQRFDDMFSSAVTQGTSSLPTEETF